jgi:uncharacterized protein
MNAPGSEQLVEQHLTLRLFIIFWRLDGNEEAIAPLLSEHLLYMDGLDRSGALFASGPFTDDPTGSGLSIVRANSAEEAAEIAATEPLANAGVRSFQIREWSLREGSLSIILGLSDGRYSLT